MSCNSAATRKRSASTAAWVSVAASCSTSSRSAIFAAVNARNRHTTKPVAAAAPRAATTKATEPANSENAPLAARARLSTTAKPTTAMATNHREAPYAAAEKLPVRPMSSELPAWYEPNSRLGTARNDNASRMLGLGCDRRATSAGPAAPTRTAVTGPGRGYSPEVRPAMAPYAASAPAMPMSVARCLRASVRSSQLRGGRITRCKGRPGLCPALTPPGSTLTPITIEPGRPTHLCRAAYAGSLSGQTTRGMPRP